MGRTVLHPDPDVNKPGHVDVINPATDAVVSALYMLTRELELTREALQRRERPAPGAFVIPRDFPQKVRVRIETLVLMSDAAAAVSLRLGSAIWQTFQLGAVDTKIIPLYITIDRGIDITLTTTAGVASGFFIGYPE